MNARTRPISFLRGQERKLGQAQSLDARSAHGAAAGAFLERAPRLVRFAAQVVCRSDQEAAERPPGIVVGGEPVRPLGILERRVDSLRRGGCPHSTAESITRETVSLSFIICFHCIGSRSGMVRHGR